MQNYFTSIEYSDNTYVGVLYEKNTNREMFRTQKYMSQSQAIKEINNYIASKQSSQQQASVLNTVKLQPITHIPGRCCGR